MISLNDEVSDDVPPQPSHTREFAAKLFEEDGWIQSLLQLEHRPEQETMARTVAGAMKADQALLFEAGTGVGKSLAYLLPGIIHAVDQSRQLVVSTHTISLQEQVDTKDLPICRRIFKAVPELKRYADFKSTVLVGKTNYLCTTRLAQALAGKAELFQTAEHAELQRIADWAAKSKEGLRHELNPPPLPEVWEWLNADSSTCSRKNCPADTCFYQRAKARLREANIIIVNHSLLFALMNAGMASEKNASRGVLFADDFVVLDEAHTVPEVATDHFGLRLSSYGLERQLKFLYNPQKRRGLFQRVGGNREKQYVEDALEASVHFFAFLAETLLSKHAIVRVREPGFAEPYLAAPLKILLDSIKSLASQLEEGKDRDELLDQFERINGYHSGINRFLTLDAEDHVHWVERSGKNGQIVNLRTAPIDVAPYLREQLFRRKTSVLCTSATLALGESIEPFQKRVGAEVADTRIVNSPFDYERNMRVYVATDLPLPSPTDAKLSLDALADYIEFCALRVTGGSLVLFTSYQDMRKIAEKLEPAFSKAKRPFWLQGQEFSRTELTRKLQKAGNGILFGTDSFWTGVDIPGASLSQVIVTRLPFDPPTHPITEAKSEWIRDRGGNPFNELTLPDALVKFRQGIGRLIRTKTDRGLITLLDARVVAKSYGRLFLDSLPKKDYVRINRETRDELFRQLL